MQPEMNLSSTPLRAIADRMAEALDDALARGLHGRVHRLAHAGTRLAPHSPLLADRLARLRLAQGRIDDALAIVEASSLRSDALRLLRAVCLIQLGRRREAHLDLTQWSRHASAPHAARRLVALLEAAHGDMAGAARALHQNIRDGEDAATLIGLVLASAAECRNEQAAFWFDRLAKSCDTTDARIDVRLLCESLALPAPANVREQVEPKPFTEAAPHALQFADHQTLDDPRPDVIGVVDGTTRRKAA